MRIAVLIGGVGGAKLAQGLVEALPPERLTFIVNTGDDFWHWGLRVCPDLDTLTYTLSGLVDAETGWGIGGDSAVVMESLARHYGGETWFRLGDRDLATHLFRTDSLRRGQGLSRITAVMTERLGIGARVLPMTDDEVETLVDTTEMGELAFQEYFVKRRWEPRVKAIRHHSSAKARIAEPARAALESADAIIIAPSNPWLSIAPILALPGMRSLLRARDAPVVAVTPIIAGDAVKGPTAKIMRELGLDVSADAVARFYRGLIAGFVNDIRNPPLADLGLRHLRVNTLMRDRADKIALARAIVDWLKGWRR